MAPRNGSAVQKAWKRLFVSHDDLCDTVTMVRRSKIFSGKQIFGSQVTGGNWRSKVEPCVIPRDFNHPPLIGGSQQSLTAGSGEIHRCATPGFPGQCPHGQRHCTRSLAIFRSLVVHLWETASSRRDDHSIESMGMVYFPIHEWLMFMVN